MTDYMTIEQVVDAARNDVANKIKKDLFTGRKETSTIESLYAQWAKDRNAAALAISTMFEEEFKKHL